MCRGQYTKEQIIGVLKKEGGGAVVEATLADLVDSRNPHLTQRGKYDEAILPVVSGSALHC